MKALEEILLQTEDEYLTGLSNKGTVKRAYKDLSGENPSVRWQEEEAEVKLGEVVCQIRAPLGNSSCSCPSRSICRHLITAILYLKQELDREEAKTGKTGSGAAEIRETELKTAEVRETEPKTAEIRETEPPGYGLEKDENGKEDSIRESDKGRENDETKGNTETECPGARSLLQEIGSLSLAGLRRAGRERDCLTMLSGIRNGDWPEIRWGIVTTVQFHPEAVAVKLLSPLEHSSCSCRSKRLCRHKAQAILAAGLAGGIWQMEEVRQSMEETLSVHGQLAQATASIKEVLELQFMTGLSRLSPEAGESMERLAVISHHAQLPALESGFRAAASEYQLYFGRKAAFRTEQLTERLLKLYRRTVLLERTEEPESFRRLAGNFRDTYAPLPRLYLTAIGARNIKSKTGYEGESYYFLEADQGRWYTWTDVRPVFYEGVRRRQTGRLGQAAAPWGLGCSREQMMGMEFFLEQGKATEEGRLSVSQDTRAELAGVRNLKREQIAAMIFWDYRLLMGDFFRKQEENGERPGEQLVLAGACGIQDASFDQVQQRFSMKLLDRNGRCLRVMVKYTEEEKLTIRVLERLSRRLEEQAGTRMIFFGIPYLEQGELCLYPIEFFGAGEIQEPGEMEEEQESEQEQRSKQEQESGIRELRYKAQQEEYEKKLRILQQLEAFCREIREVSSSMFQCGLNSLQEETIRELERLAMESQVQGLYLLGQELEFLAEGLGGKRHGTEVDLEPVLASWIRLEACLGFCMEKIGRDRCMIRMEVTGTVPAP